MSIRCSLLGHSYGDSEIEREREEQGSEVVVTVREFEECERCGERKVVTENKEVTALDSTAPDLESTEEGAAEGSASGASASDGPTASADAGPAASGVAEEAVSAGGDDAVIIDDSTDDEPSAADSSAASTADRSAGSSAPGDASSTADDFEREQSAADDDGVILDDDGGEGGEDGDRTPGEWPDAETTHPSEVEESGPSEWPEVGREDEGFDAEPDDGGSADVEFGGGLTPESSAAADEDDEVEFVNAEGDALRARNDGRQNAELSSGISAGAEAPNLSGPADDPDVDAEFVCPECDYRDGVAGSSLRAGDICPECARGYLARE